MKTITMTIQKGGAGKTTVAYHLAHALARSGKRVLAIDLDPQGSMSQGFAPRDSYTAFSKDIFDAQVPQPVPQAVRENLWLLAANRQLTIIDKSASPDVLWSLPVYLDEQAENFDFAILDTPPNMGQLPTAALGASDGVVIPLTAEGQAIDGMRELQETILGVKRTLNKTLKVVGYVLNNVNWARGVSKVKHDGLRETLKDELFQTVIGMNVRVTECWDLHQTVYEYDPGGKAAMEYDAFTEEFLRRLTDEPETAAA